MSLCTDADQNPQRGPVNPGSAYQRGTDSMEGMSTWPAAPQQGPSHPVEPRVLYLSAASIPILPLGTWGNNNKVKSHRTGPPYTKPACVCVLNLDLPNEKRETGQYPTRLQKIKFKQDSVQGQNTHQPGLHTCFFLLICRPCTAIQYGVKRL